MSKFTDKRSPAYAAAVEALLKLPLDVRRRAFADAAAPEMERGAAHVNRRSTAKTRSWRWLFGRRTRWDHRLDAALPGDDHAELWLGAEPVYVSHPYNLTLDDMRAIVTTCDANNLECQVDALSWYFPGRTIRVEWRAATGARP